MVPKELWKQIRQEDACERRKGFAAIWEQRSKMAVSQADILDLYDFLTGEKDLETRSYGAIVTGGLNEFRRARPADKLQDWFFKPFEPLNGVPRSDKFTSLVAAVCDRQNVRDFDALVMMARFLPASRYYATKFHHVSLQRQDWRGIHLDEITTFCLLGHPSMFRRCRPVESLPALRFKLPERDAVWRGGRVSEKSKKHYHHVRQDWKPAFSFCYCTSQIASKEGGDQKVGERTDYAVVQRFQLQKDSVRPVTVIVLAGASSLGTAGAARWVTDGALGKMTLSQAKQFAGRDIVDSTTMEALLKVTGDVYSPPRPWWPECKVEKLFFDDSVNILCQKGPEIITLGIAGTGRIKPHNVKPENVRYILFDNDGVSIAGSPYTALIALCLNRAREKPKELLVPDLIQDTTLWPSGKCFLNNTNAFQFIHDHLQKHRLRKSLVLEEKSGRVHLNADVKFRHS